MGQGGAGGGCGRGERVAAVVVMGVVVMVVVVECDRATNERNGVDERMNGWMDGK